MIFFGPASLQHAVRQFMAHYHTERNHQGLENRLPQPASVTALPAILFNADSASAECSATTIGPQPDEYRLFFRTIRHPRKRAGLALPRSELEGLATPENALRDSLGSRDDRRRHGGARREACSFDCINDEARRKLAQSPRQTIVSPRRSMVDVQPDDRAARAAALSPSHRSDGRGRAATAARPHRQYHSIGLRPLIKQSQHVARARDDAAVSQRPVGAHPTRDQEADRIIGAIRIPDSDHEQPAFRTSELMYGARELEEVGRTRNARIIIADGLFATVPERVLSPIDISRRHLTQILLDAQLILRRWRHDAGIEDDPAIIDFVAMVADTARRLGTAMADAGPKRHRNRRHRGRLIGCDQAQRFWQA